MPTDYEKPLIHVVDSTGNKVAVTTTMLGSGTGGANTNTIVYTEEELTSPGTTTPRQMTNFRDAAWSVKVANINTSVSIRFEGSMNNTDWFNLYGLSEDIVINSNGTFYYQKNNCNIEYIRFNFVSELGGTTAIINVITRLT